MRLQTHMALVESETITSIMIKIITTDEGESERDGEGERERKQQEKKISNAYFRFGKTKFYPNKFYVFVPIYLTHQMKLFLLVLLLRKCMRKVNFQSSCCRCVALLSMACATFHSYKGHEFLFFFFDFSPKLRKLHAQKLIVCIFLGANNRYKTKKERLHISIIQTSTAKRRKNFWKNWISKAFSDY